MEIKNEVMEDSPLLLAKSKVQSTKKNRRIFEEIAPSKLNGIIKITKKRVICPPLVEALKIMNIAIVVGLGRNDSFRNNRVAVYN